MRYTYGNAHGPCGMEAYGNTHELYGNAYERCDYFHGGMVCLSSLGQHASTIMQSVMNTEEGGFPWKRNCSITWPSVPKCSRPMMQARRSPKTQQPHGRLPLRRMRAMKPLRPLPTSCLTCSRVVHDYDGVIAFAEGPRKAAHGRGGRCGNARRTAQAQGGRREVLQLSVVHRGKRAACEVRSHRAVAPLRPKAAASKARR